jgi:hypothetical protein
MDRWSVRLRMLLEEYLVVIVVALLALALVGAYFSYAPHFDPGTETEVVEDARWSSSGQYSHQATVQRDTEVFSNGTVLRNRGSYFARVAPILNGTFVYQYDATDGGDLQINTTTAVVLRSVGEGDNDEQLEYWRLEEPLGSRSAESVGPGSPVGVSFSMNVSAMNNRLSRIDEQLGGTPGNKEVVVESRVVVTGTRNGRPVNQQRVYEMQIDAGGNVYSVANAGPQTNSGVLTSEVTVEATYGPLRSLGAPLLALLALLTCLGLAVGWYQDLFVVTDAEREWLTYTESYREFDDWITPGRLPEEMLSSPQSSVDSLDGLVDIAIDSNRRVIEDRDRALCGVFVDNVLYTYEIPAVVQSADRSDPLAADDATDGEHGSPIADGADGTRLGDDEDAADDADEDESESADDGDGDEGDDADEDEPESADDADGTR